MKCVGSINEVCENLAKHFYNFSHHSNPLQCYCDHHKTQNIDDEFDQYALLSSEEFFICKILES